MVNFEKKKVLVRGSNYKPAHFVKVKGGLKVSKL